MYNYIEPRRGDIFIILKSYLKYNIKSGELLLQKNNYFILHKINQKKSRKDKKKGNTIKYRIPFKIIFISFIHLMPLRLQQSLIFHW